MKQASTAPGGVTRRERWLAAGFVASLATAGYLALEAPLQRGADDALEVSLENAPPDVRPHRRPAPPPTAGSYLGVVLANESVDVVAEIEGHVREVLVRPGDAVAAGAPLVILDNESLDHQLTIEQGNLALIDAEVKSFTVQFERTNQVYRRRAALEGLLSREEAEASEAQLEIARHRLDVAHAEMTQARGRIAQLQARRERRTIRAPFAGTVAIRHLDRGAVVARGTPVVRLISADASRLRFAMPPAAAEEPLAGTRVRVEIESLGRSVLGVVEHRSPEIDAASEMIFVESRLDPGGAPIPPGSPARVSLLGPKDEPTPPAEP